MSVALRRFLLLTILVSCASRSQPAEVVEPLVLDGATIIVGTGAAPIRDGVVVIREGRIELVGSAETYAPPDGATIMDLRGKWLIPGLSDMHVHIFGAAVQTQEVLSRLLAFGVTTMRITAAPETDDGEGGVITREQVLSGGLLGPNVFTAGPMLDASKSRDWAAIVETADDVRTEVRRQAAAGVDFIKFYVGLGPDLIGVGITEAHAAGLETIGHLGATGWAEAAELGIDHLVHSGLSGPTWELSEREDVEHSGSFFVTNDILPNLDFESPKAVVLARLLADKGVTVEPDLVLTEAMYWSGDPQLLEDRLEPEIGPAWLTAPWIGNRQVFGSRPDDTDRRTLQSTFESNLGFIRLLHDSGVRLLVGTDLMNPWMTPGVSVHREMALLSEAGISNMDVLTIATRNAAASVDRLEDFGTLEVGKRADLVVLAADPLADIRNTRKIEWVVKDGETYDPKELLGDAP